MPKLTNRPPRLCHEKRSGQAVVRLERKKIYVGPWGLPETKQNYDRIISEWLAHGRPLLKLTIRTLPSSMIRRRSTRRKKGDRRCGRAECGVSCALSDERVILGDRPVDHHDGETDKVKALPTLHKYFQKKDTGPVDLAAPRSTYK